MPRSSGKHLKLWALKNLNVNHMNFSDNCYFFHFLEMMQFAFLIQSTGKEDSCSGKNSLNLTLLSSFSLAKRMLRTVASPPHHRMYPLTVVHRVGGFNSPLLPHGAVQLTLPKHTGLRDQGSRYHIATWKTRHEKVSVSEKMPWLHYYMLLY